jgi:hypothetical protein
LKEINRKTNPNYRYFINAIQDKEYEMIKMNEAAQ